MLFQPLAMGADEIDAAQCLEHVVHGAEIGIAILRIGEDMTEARHAVGEHAPDVVVDRRAAEICRNCDADICEIDLRQHVRDVQGVIAGEQVALVDVDLRLEQQMRVGDGAAHRSIDGKRRDRGRPLRGGNDAGRRPEPRHAAERGRRAQAAAVIRSRGERQHASRQRHR